MKIAIISDIHENFHNLILALQKIEKQEIQQIICLGDLMNNGIAKLLASQSIPVYMIWGNNDGEKVAITLASKKENSSLSVSSNVYDFLEINQRKVFISHYDDLAIPMAKSGEYDAVFYGHTHIHSIEKIKSCWVVNPGEIAAGKTKKATFVIYDTTSNEVELITLADSISLKTPLMEAYFEEHGTKMGLRSKALQPTKEISSLSDKNLIPLHSPVYKNLELAAETAKAVVFSGLPGVGKSLYINQFQLIAAAKGKQVTVIQWDIARKSFETDEIFERFPMGDGTVHNGVKLGAGKWLIDTIKDWLKSHTSDEELLLIEAPLVGHRFIEVATIQEDTFLENFFRSPAFQIIVPIPSRRVRAKIEADRSAQISDDAKVWSGAKPSVMLMLWKMVCGIANEFGRTIPMEGQPPYDPEIYEFVFAKILQYRHFIPLHINEIYPIVIVNESELHDTGSLAADAITANEYAKAIANQYPDLEEIDLVVNGWYLT